MTIRINPEFKALIPRLAPEELAQLEANIVADGCRDPLVHWNGTIVDGHNRFEICGRRHIGFKTVAKEFASERHAKLWIIENQEGRRNLKLVDKVMLKQSKQDLIAEEAAERQKTEGAKQGHRGREGGRGNKKPLVEKLPQGVKSPQQKTRDKIAAEIGTSGRTVDAANLVIKAAQSGEIDKQTFEDVRSDKKSVHRVAKDIKEKRQRDARESKRNESAKSAPSNESIIIGDFRHHADKVADGSVSLIFTDPPYDRGSIPLFEALGRFAAHKLAEGGSLLCYVGHIQIPAAIKSLSTWLRYFWVIACIHQGNNKTIMREYGIKCGWKAVLWFVKGTRDNNTVMVDDTMSGGKEKSSHEWQQAESEASYWIEKLCPKDGIVCDPFLGGGTTAAAAKDLGRKWIGFEIDEKSAKIASGRVAK